MKFKRLVLFHHVDRVIAKDESQVLEGNFAFLTMEGHLFFHGITKTGRHVLVPVASVDYAEEDVDVPL